MVQARPWVILLAVGVLTSCTKPASPPAPAKDVAVSTNQQVFQVTGVIQEVRWKQKEVEIKHEAVAGYMPAMTMPFDVKDTNELAGLEPGQRVEFRLLVTDTEGWIDHVRKLGQPTNAVSTSSTVHVVRDVAPLEVGGLLPEYHLINQFGQAFSTRQYLGQALALTFLFTRCPYPTFCPRMANNFEEVQQKMLALANGPTNWQLLTVSFDPEFDKPEVLKAYAEAHHYDAGHSTFATGELIDVTALAEQFGLAFWKDEGGSINHNLRTVIIDGTGRVQKIFEGNTWTPAELAVELTKASQRTASAAVPK